MSAPGAEAPAGRRTPGMILAALGALGLGLLAVGAALGALAPSAHAADQVAAIPNLLTALASLVGAVGYWQARKWGVIAYLLSVGGHLLIHAAFLLAAAQSGRLTPISAAGLAVIPAVALLVLAGMLVAWRRGRLT